MRIKQNDLALNDNMSNNKSMRVLLGSIFYFLIFFSKGVNSESIPKFSFQDQYGNQASTSTVLGKPIVLIGCEIQDVDLCRKVGRKIYWKMQNLLWKDADKVTFLPYLNLTKSNLLIEKYIEESKLKEFESMYLDRKGDLAFDLRREQVFLRIFNRKGTQIFLEYLEKADESKIKELYEILRKII